MSVVDQSSSAAASRRMPFTVKLSPQLVNGLVNRQLPFSTSSGEVSGLLYGLAEGGSVVVQAFRPFQDGKTVSGFRDRTEQNQILQQHLTLFSKEAETAALQLVGWYTLRLEGGLTGGDLTYHNWFFPRPNDLALIVRPDGASDVMLELFCRATTGVLSEDARRVGLARLSPAAVEQPVEVVLGANIQDVFFMRAYEDESEDSEEPEGNWKDQWLERSRHALSWLRRPSKPPRQQPLPSMAVTAQSRGSVGRDAGGSLLQSSATGVQTISTLVPPIAAASPSLVSAPLPSLAARTRPPWIAAALVFIAASAVSFGGLYYLRTTDRSESWLRFLRSAPPPSALGLRLEAQGDRLLLSWNRQDVLVRHASNGFLEIVDGRLRRQIVLDASQVANGSILYHPTSDDVSFQLEVRGADGRHEAESMRVLEAPKPPALDLSPEQPGARKPAIDISRREPERQLKPPTVAPSERKPLEAPAPAALPETAGNPPAPNLTRPTAESPSSSAKLTVPEASSSAVPEDVSEPREPTIPASTAAPEPIAPGRQPAVTNPVQKQLATPSSYQPPRPTRQILPNIRALSPSILADAGQVEILVKVNTAGQVTSAQFVPHGRTSHSVVIGASLAAAKLWQFAPALLNAKPVESEHSILFQFSKGR